MSAAEKVLARLEGVRKAGEGRWMAKCPAHDEKTASLSIRDRDGKVLMHCFGCGANGSLIIERLGLRVSELFDGGALPQHRVERPAGIHPNDAIMVLDHELTVAWLLLHDALERQLSAEELRRLSTCASRVGKVRDAICPVEIKELREQREARARKEIAQA